MSASSAAAPSQHVTTTAFSVLAAISFCHLLNDMMQSLLPALYPILKENYALTFGQIGILTFTFQVTASLLQPVIGVFTDKRPQPYSLSTGMAFTFAGLLLFALTPGDQSRAAFQNVAPGVQRSAVGRLWSVVGGRLRVAVPLYLLWLSVALLVVVLLWPALWVDPSRALGSMPASRACRPSSSRPRRSAGG